MLDSHELQSRTAYSLIVDASFSPGAKSSENLHGSLFRVAEDRALAWLLQGKDWSRWRSVKTKTPATLDLSPAQQKIAALIRQYAPARDKQKSESVDSDERLKRNLDEIEQNSGMEGLKELLDTPAAPNEPQYLDLLPPPEYSATLGYVMHNSTMQPSKANSLAEVLEEKPDRVFCENIPGLTYLVDSHHHLASRHHGTVKQNTFPTPPMDNALGFDLDPDTGEARVRAQLPPPTEQIEDVDPSTYTMSIRFSPSPWEHGDDFERYPPVEMEVEVDSVSGEVRNPKVVAVYSDSVVDLLLPARECDVRFRRRVVVPLYMDKSGKDVKSASDVASLEGTGPATEAKDVAEGETDDALLEDQGEKSTSEETTTGWDDLVENQGEKGTSEKAIIEENGFQEKKEVVEEEGVEAEPAEEITEPGKKPLTGSGFIASHLPDQSSSILSYIAASRLNPTRNDRLQPAPELTLQIPAYLCTPSTPPAEGVTFSDTKSPFDTAPVKYFFTKMSHITTTPLKRHHYHLNKKVVEGGATGGRKTILEMDFKLIENEEVKPWEVANWGTWTESVLGLVKRLGEVTGQRGGVFKR